MLIYHYLNILIGQNGIGHEKIYQISIVKTRTYGFY